MIRLVSQQPNVENTVPIGIYQLLSPEQFSLDDDKFVVYGGGTNYKVTVAANDPHHALTIAPELQAVDFNVVTVYVLNTLLLLWFPRLGLGIEFSYPGIVLHALKGQDVLHLEVVLSELITATPNEVSDFTSCVELELSKNPDHDYEDALFAPGQSDMAGIYSAMSTCLALHQDLDLDVVDADADEPAVPTSWITALGSAGDADDLDGGESEGGSVAGMSVDVGWGSVLGKRGAAGNDSNKRKRVSKE